MSSVKYDYEQAFINGLHEVLERNKREARKSDGQPDIPKVDLKEVREALGVSQADFAQLFGIPLATLRNWEQGRAEPDTPTSRYLYLISQIPNEVALEIGKLPRK